jgi:anaerobic magnesium-protoporphyrin IX monomethyl ester cyclase
MNSIPPIRLSTVEKEGVPISAKVKQLIGDETEVQISYPGVGAVVLASYLKRNGITVHVRDWYLDTIDAAAYGIIGISGSLLTLFQLQDIVKSLHAANSNAIIVVGGPITHTYSLDTLLSTIPEIHFVIFHEGEKSFLELIQALRNGWDVSNIAGIGYQRDGIAFQSPLREPLSPNEILSPDWSMVNMSKRHPVLSIETARGCTYHCAYCSEVEYWGKPVRFRSLQSVIDEIIDNYSRFGIAMYRFADSCLTAPEERCEQLCDAIISQVINRGIPLKWSCYGRINNLTDSLLAKMKSAGCVAIGIGMESGAQTVLKKMNKLYTPEQIISGISNARKNGIITHCNIIVGFPGETKQTIEYTVTILNSAKPDTFHCMLFDIAPHTLVSQNKTGFEINGDRLTWSHETMTSHEAFSAMAEIICKVNPSCHIPMGDVISILLISAGNSQNDATALFASIASGTAGKREADMLNTAMRKSAL